MAELEGSNMSNVSPLGHLAVFNQPEAVIGGVDVSLSVKTNLGIAQVFARRGQAEQLAAALNIGSQPGKASSSDKMTALPLSPGQWLLVSPTGADGQWCEQLKEKLNGVGYISEQSHSRVVFRVSGPKARQVMQKGCRLDLHPSQAPVDFCAQTSMAQVGVLIHLVDDTPTYDIYVYSGFADSFWSWLSHSAAEFQTPS